MAKSKKSNPRALTALGPLGYRFVVSAPESWRRRVEKVALGRRVTVADLRREMFFRGLEAMEKEG